DDEPLATPEAVARKLVTQNISDLASKGALPLYAILTIGVPGETSMERLRRFYRGLDEDLTLHGARLIGGDTVRAPQWTLSLTLVGTLDESLPIASRSRAMVGQHIYVTGWPGESGAGYALLNHEANLPVATR